MQDKIHGYTEFWRHDPWIPHLAPLDELGVHGLQLQRARLERLLRVLSRVKMRRKGMVSGGGVEGDG